MTRKVAFVGSSVFPMTASIGAQIVDVLRALGPDVVLLTRGNGDIDRFLTTVAPLLDIRCFMYPSEGGASNWLRDVELVRDADEVIAIISRADLEARRTGGTLHVVEKALDQRKPTRLYTEEGGMLVGVAENDGTEEMA